MSQELLVAGLLVAIVAVAVALLILSRRSGGTQVAQEAPQADAAAGEGEDAREMLLKKGARTRGNLRNRAAQKAAASTQQEDADPLDGPDGEEDGQIPEFDKDGKKIGTKKREKLMAKEEKRARNEQIKAEREDEKERQKLREEEAKKEEERKAEAERKVQEEEEKKKELERKKEQEEYENMKAMFSVEDDGSVADVIAEESQGLLGEFVDYVKQQKVVLVEELAAHFKLKSADAINRLQSLESMGYIKGVMDDRGKFIYISDQEMDAVCKFIRQRGRVSIAELAENSNKLIKLQGETPATAAASSG